MNFRHQYISHCIVSCLLVFCILLTSCVPKTTISGSGTPQTGQSSLSHELQEAYTLLEKGEYVKATSQFGNIISNNKTTPADRIIAFKGWGAASASLLTASNAKRYLEALVYWSSLDETAELTTAWQSLWEKALTLSPKGEARNAAATLTWDSGHPWESRIISGAWLSHSLWSDGQYASALHNLNTLVQSAKKTTDLALYEKAVLSKLQSSTPKALQDLLSYCTAENDTRLPYKLFILEDKRRAWLAAGSQDARATLEQFVAAGSFATPDMLALLLGQVQPVSNNQTIALVLPLTGSFSEIAWKILRGATVAQWELNEKGITLNIEVINSEAPGWLEQIAQLPANCTVIGSGLTTNTFAAMKQANIPATKTIFSFTQRLPDGDEGRTGWRFFTSGADQVDAILEFSKTLGISTYSIFHDNATYGQRMSALFKEQAATHNQSVLKEGTYPAGNHQAWNSTVASFLGVNRGGRLREVHSPFKATFLPITWKDAEMIVPNFFFFLETKQVFFGTLLWEQALLEAEKVDSRNFNLALFPGAWDAALPSDAALQLGILLERNSLPKPDFWIGLGYDFIRFTSQTALPAGQKNADQINSILATRTPMDWSIAPLQWDTFGIAKQKLFMFTPTPTGFAKVTAEQFMATYKAALGRRVYDTMNHR